MRMLEVLTRGLLLFAAMGWVGCGGGPSSADEDVVDGDAHAFFEELRVRPDAIVVNSLRTQIEIDAVAQKNPQTTWVYDPTMDAARGTMVGTYPGDSDIDPQLWFPVNASDGSVVIVWDYLRTSAWEAEPVPFQDPSNPSTTRSGLRTLKSFQLRTVSNDRAFEVRNHFSHGGPGEVALIDMRSYHASMGSGTYRNRENLDTGIQGNDSDTVQPLLTRAFVHGDKWLRYVMRIELNPGAFDRCSLWVIEEGGRPIQVYDAWEGEHKGALHHFDIEEDSSQGRAPGSAPLHAYIRNVVILRNVDNVSRLLRAPVR